MKKLNLLLILSLVLSFIIAFQGCGKTPRQSSNQMAQQKAPFSNDSTKTPQEAKDELAKMNIRYNEGEFIVCVIGGHTKVVKLYLDAGMNPNTKTRYDFTALMEAASDGYTEIVRALLAKGAEVNAKNNKGETALSLAISQKHPDIVKLLKDAGAKE